MRGEGGVALPDVRGDAEVVGMGGGEVEEALGGDDVEALGPGEGRVVAGLPADHHLRDPAFLGHVGFELAEVMDRLFEAGLAFVPAEADLLAVGAEVDLVLGHLGVADGEPGQPERPLRGFALGGVESLAAVGVSRVAGDAGSVRGGAFRRGPAAGASSRDPRCCTARGGWARWCGAALRFAGQEAPERGGPFGHHAFADRDVVPDLDLLAVLVIVEPLVGADLVNPPSTAPKLLACSSGPSSHIP